MSGRRADKFAALELLELDGPDWMDCGDDWGAPFRPAGAADWTAMPALGDLLGWSNSGTQPSRTWVIAPSPTILAQRWQRLIAAPADEKGALLVEGRDRSVSTALSDNLPGYPVRGALGNEKSALPDPVRYGWRTLDRGWLIPDKRVINYPRPELWQIRGAPGQLFLTTVDRMAPSAGPATSFSALVPDLDHHHGRGGRAFPLWLDSAGTRPNVLPGLLEAVSARVGASVTGPDLFAFVAALTAHPGYVERFRDDLLTPGLRIPLTADADRFVRAVELGNE